MVVSSQEKEQDVLAFPTTIRIVSPGNRSILLGQRDTEALKEQLITPNFVLNTKRLQTFPYCLLELGFGGDFRVSRLHQSGSFKSYEINFGLFSGRTTLHPYLCIQMYSGLGSQLCPYS